MRWTEERYQDYLRNKGITEKKEEKKTEKRSKYNNTRGVVDGHKFDSIKEADYYQYLKVMKEHGFIEGFELQPKFRLLDGFTKNGVRHRPIDYIADFKVFHEDGTVEIIDVKSSPNNLTQVYIMKKKMFEYKYDELSIKEVYEVPAMKFY